jgi:hypothetical protein
MFNRSKIETKTGRDGPRHTRQAASKASVKDGLIEKRKSDPTGRSGDQEFHGQNA